MTRQTLTTLLSLHLLLGFGGFARCDAGDDDDATRSTIAPTIAPTLEPTEQPTLEPTSTPLPEGMCRSDTDCTSSGGYCLPPGASGGCGICYEPEGLCYSTEDCGTGEVCGPISGDCFCSNPTYVCMAACTETSCAEGERCGEDGLCEIISCTEGTFSCPDLTTCMPGASGDGCVRWSCSTDQDCGTGNACVEGACYDGYGTCNLPVPRPASGAAR